MNYNLNYGTDVPMKEQLAGIVSSCDSLEANETLTVFGFGKDGDLSLHISKNGEFDRSQDSFNMVAVHTSRNRKFIDDTGDIHVTDGSLRRELTRIWKGRKLSLY